jgi:hypothetical protein
VLPAYGQLVREYLVEVYVPRNAAPETPGPEEVRRAAGEVTSSGTPVRLVGSLFVPDDEMYLYLFEASSGEAAHEATTRSGLRPARVLQAVSGPAPTACGRS